MKKAPSSSIILPSAGRLPLFAVERNRCVFPQGSEAFRRRSRAKQRNGSPGPMSIAGRESLFPHEENRDDDAKAPPGGALP